MITKLLAHPLYKKLINRETISYIFWGCATTVVNWVVNYIAYDILHISTMWSTIIAWLDAVIFAFFVNKLFVFQSRSWSPAVLYKEFLPFISCRILSGLFDVAFMVITVDHLHILNGLAKLLSNVFVMIANYFASKFLIFKKSSNTSGTGISRGFSVEDSEFNKSKSNSPEQTVSAAADLE